MMKILLDYQERKAFPECPNYIPDILLNEDMAECNHGQTLNRLNERGGLGPEEIMANIHRLKLPDTYKKYTTKQAIYEIINMLK